MASSCRKYSSTWTCGRSGRGRRLRAGEPPTPAGPGAPHSRRTARWGRSREPQPRAEGGAAALSPDLGHLPCAARWEPLPGHGGSGPAGRGHRSRPGRRGHRTWDMTSRDQLSVMEMAWLGLAGGLFSFSEGRSSVGPNTVARLCRDILFTVSFSATLWGGGGRTAVTPPGGWGRGGGRGLLPS